MTAVLRRSDQDRAQQGSTPETGPGSAKRTTETTRSRWYWRNWPVVVKLAAVLLVPTIVALVAGVLRIVDQAGAAPGYVRITQIVRAQQQLSELIGSVARERDLATAFVATGRTGDRRALDAQFRTVDGNIGAVSTAVGKVGRLDFARSTIGGLGSLVPLRASVTTGFGPVEVVVSEYSDAIDPLIELDSALTRQLDDVAVTNDAAATHSLLAGREQVSRQHAIVLAALYANRLGPGQIEDLRTATVKLATEQDAVRSTLEPAERADAIAGIGPDAELARQRVLQLVLNRGLAAQPLNTSPEDWDRRTAVVVDNIADVEKVLRQRIELTAQRLLDHVRTAAGLNSVILFFALGLGVLIGILVTRALLRPLGVLKRTALDVADRRLPDAMARIREGESPEMAIEPVPVGTSEEIGQVARAFDEVHSQAVRLASEQVQLRSNVNDIFVNLSRRTQGLVERQLKLIDRLESGEQDPQQLDNLFQLDHLATRMRRNSENLLVLAGTEATNRSGRPVRLIDVLRAAVSEVEQYQRLVLQQPPAVLVLGRTAGDLVHLLAELLDNATQFSPPDSQVMVSSDLAGDGGVAIEVADRGVGMSEEEIGLANQRLARPTAVDGSVSRRMGLFVVGRLASRHGIEVQLRRGDSGVGIWASVLMPSRLVRVAVEPIEPAVARGQELTGAQDSTIRRPPIPKLATSRLLSLRPETPSTESLGAEKSGFPDHRPEANGSVPGSLAAALMANRNGVPVPRPHAEADAAPDIKPDVEVLAAELESVAAQNADNEATTAQLTDGDDEKVSDKVAVEAGIEQTDDADESPADGDPLVQLPAGPDPLIGSGLPKRNGNRATRPEPQPSPPGPPAGSPEASSTPVPSMGSGADLFRPARPSVPGPAAPVHRVTLQHSTPIFDDVASAWFKEHEAVPVRWTAPSMHQAAGKSWDAPARQSPSPDAPARQSPSPDAPARQSPLPDAPLPDAPATEVVPGVASPAEAPPAEAPPAPPAPVTAPGPVSPPPLTRRQPGRTLVGSESGPASKLGPSSQPVPVSEQTPAVGRSDWGAGDAGWRAAQALAQPLSADVTPMGLPRRQPRALLVPGAAGVAEPTSAPPARSAESIRGRLANYQQGVREGRQARQGVARNAGGSEPEQQDGEEETT